MSAAKTEELLIALFARMIGRAKHVAVGAASPIPAAAALLAKAVSPGPMHVSLLSSRRHNFFTDGGRELFDCAGQGRVDVFFLSGGQIDGEANVNLVATGPYERPAVRFPGSFGSSYLYFAVPRVILFRLEHSRRTLVDRVDFVSAPGTSPPGIWRPGGPVALVTALCRFDFDRTRRRFTLASLHPGHTVDEVRLGTGFGFDVPAEVPETPIPDAETLRLLRGPIARELAEVYPAFANDLFGLAVRRSSHEELMKP